MRTVAEHLAACLEIAQPAPPLDVVLLDAVGCVLAEDVVADLDLPAADLAGLDGYAVMSADLSGAAEAAPVVLEVMDSVRAGETHPTRLVPGAAVLIDSGAPLPLGADAVVPWAVTDRGRSRVRVRAVVGAGDNVRRRADDVAAGTTVLPRGSRVSARQIALLGGIGRYRVKVLPSPRVVIVSIGDELVEPGQSQLYEIDVPSDHPAGTFWYHSHFHGSTALQVSSGMAGALIIRGNRYPSGNTNGDLDTLLKSTAGTRVQERLLMLQQISYGCVGTDGKLKRMPANGGDNQGPNARLPPLRCDDGDVGSVDNYDALDGPNSWRDSGRFTTVNGVTLPRFVGAVAGRLEPQGI